MCASRAGVTQLAECLLPKQSRTPTASSSLLASFPSLSRCRPDYFEKVV